MIVFRAIPWNEIDEQLAAEEEQPSETAEE